MPETVVIFILILLVFESCAAIICINLWQSKSQISKLIVLPAFSLKHFENGTTSHLNQVHDAVF